MPIATVTSKGQITLPKKIRERLRLRAGDRVEFRIEGDGSVRLFPIAKKVSEVFGAFASKATKARSPKDMKREVKKAFKEGRL